MASIGYKYEYNSPIHPKLFALWLGIGSIVMSFAGLTSAYIVKKGAGYWVEFNLPQFFTYSTLVVVLSSVFIQLAYWSYKKLHNKLATVSLLVTFVLGIIFLNLQYQGWLELTNTGIELDGNPSGSFVYVISGLHFAHIVGGLLAMFFVILGILWRNRKPVKKLMEETNPERNTHLKLMTTYWHFVGLLWLYLFIFFQYN